MILVISLVLLALNLVTRSLKGTVKSESKASSIRWMYEIGSQLSRATAVAFVAIAYVQGRAHFMNVTVLVYAFVLGLLRLYNDLKWRHIALHQINFVTTATLLNFFLAQFLPCIQLNSQCSKDPGLIGGIAALGASVLVALITPREWLPPQPEFEIPGVDLDRNPAPEETVSWINYYFAYDWLTTVIWKGTWGKLDMSGLPKIAWYDEPLYLLRRVQEARKISVKSLWTTMRFLRKELSLMALWIALAYGIENLQAFAMFKLLDYLAKPDQAIYEPSIWLILLFVGPLSRSIFYQQYIFNSTRLIVRVKSAMTQELYHKALESMELEDDPFDVNRFKEDPTPKKNDGKRDGKGDGKKDGKETEKPKDDSQKSTSAGRLANMMAADVDAIYRTRDVIIAGVGVPVGAGISIIGLYTMLGWPALVGTSLIFISAPISAFLSKIMLSQTKKVRKAQDTRISLVTEYLASIRAIKYFAWESAIAGKIISARAREQQRLWIVAVIQISFYQVMQIFPIISLLVMLALYVGVVGKPLDASTAFTSVFLLKNIRRNIMEVSYFFRSFASALVSLGRLDKYFNSTVPLPKYPVGPLRIENASFRRNKKATFSLEDISIDFVEGGLNVITGQSGSGKSTLLLSILGETYLEAGSITKPEDVAFASQSAWLQNDSIKKNILFCSEMEEVRYNRVVEACCLPVDLKELSEGDETVIGENGASLSGGQKARVALARALYSKAPLLLLDDIFSALDAKTAASIWKHCFCGDLLKNRTVVLVTQVPWISNQGDLSITLEKGQIKTLEQNIGVARQPIVVADVLGGDDEDEVIPEPELQATSDALNDVQKTAEPKPDQKSKIVDAEMKATGKVGRLTYFKYMGYFGHPIFTVACIAVMVLSNACFFFEGLWLSIWVEAYDLQEHVSILFYLGIYASFSILELISSGALTVLFEWGGWRAAKRLHNEFILAILGVSLSWFNAIPVGRITNRFSSDISSIDGRLSGMVQFTLDMFMTLFARLAAVSTIMPVFMVPAFFTCLLGAVVGEMYTRTAVVLKRLTSSAQSPVFSQFADTLAGLSVIRARSGMSDAFGKELADKLRDWSAAAETSYNCNRWVAIRVDLVASLISVSAGIIALSQTGKISAGLVGFSLTNANALNKSILMIVRGLNELEIEMQSFNRVTEYVKLDHEEKDDEVYPDAGEGAYADDETKVIPKNWPRSGAIEFRNVTVRYDLEGPNILTNVNLKFKAGERVAVVGRTGSGKSTVSTIAISVV